MTSTIGVKVDAETKERLRKLATQRERSPHWLMRKALEEFLVREERVERERQEDAHRWERYLLTGNAVDHEDARAWLQSLADGEPGLCPG